MGKILVIGSSNTDMVVYADNMPKPGETVFGKEFAIFQGGKGANQAVAAARAGANVTFVSKLGNDDFAKKAVEAYLKEGINTNHILFSEDQPTGNAVIIVDKNSGENSIVLSPGANAQLNEKDIENLEEVISQNDALVVQLESPIKTVKKALEIAKKHKLITILDPAPAQKLDLDLLALVDYITPNESECEFYTGIKPNGMDNLEMASDKLIEMVGVACILTLGSQGSYYKNNLECSSLVPTRKVDVIDTTAAGDTFNGYFAKYISENKALDEAILLANRAAASSVTKKGAQDSIPRKSDLE